MKRFWDHAEPAQAAGAWNIVLDGRPLRVPGGDVLTLPTRALAEAIAAEWQAAGGGKGGQARVADLPLTQLANTAQARVAPDPEPVALELARYAQTDLLCYRAPGPAQLVRRQAALWQPWLDWAAAVHGATLRVTAGLVAVPQDPDTLARLAAAVRAHDVPSLAGLGVLVPALGSLVLGLAVAEGALDAGAAYDLSVLDDMFQQESWGEDAEAAARRARVRAEAVAAGRYMALAGA